MIQQLQGRLARFRMPPGFGLCGGCDKMGNRLNIIQGDNGQIKPQDTVVRAVGATIITRFIKNIL